MLVKVKNDLTEKAQKTYTTAAIASGVTAIPWRNQNAFTASWAIQLGETGEEKAEIRLLGTAAVAAGSGTVTVATSFDHPADTPIYAIKYNQVVFERSTSGTSGTATPIDGGTISITPDSIYTQYDDTSGSASYAYKTYWRNSVLGVDSTESGWMTSSGASFYSLAKIREIAKGKSLNDYPDDNWNDWANEWLERMNNAAIDVNEDYRIGTVDIAFSGTAQYGTIPGTCNFKAVRRAWYTEGGTDWAQMTKQEYVDFHPDEEFDETHPYYHMMGDDEIGRNPHEISGTVRLSFYKLNTVLTNDNDELPTPMKGYTGSFVKWMVAQSYRKDKMIKEAAELEREAELDRERFKQEMTPRNKSGPTYIDLQEEIAVDDLDGLW